MFHPAEKPITRTVRFTIDVRVTLVDLPARILARPPQESAALNGWLQEAKRPLLQANHRVRQALFYEPAIVDALLLQEAGARAVDYLLDQYAENSALFPPLDYGVLLRRLMHHLSPADRTLLLPALEDGTARTLLEPALDVRRAQVTGFSVTMQKERRRADQSQAG